MQKDCGLVIQHADCQAAIFFDPVRKAIANVHCGWRGSVCNIYAKTVEKITLPRDIIGNLEGRSRFARMGLVIHITSALVQPGSNNHQVLEIVNLAPFTVKLHAGMRISQVVFEKLISPTTKPYAKFGKIAIVKN